MPTALRPIPVLLAALALPAAKPALAQPRSVWTTGTFVYADLCTAPDGGGLGGRRVTVRRSPNGDGVLYETASGGLAAPVAAAALSIDDARREIAFTVERPDGPVRFRGTAAPDVLAGTLTDGSGEHPLRLRRVLRSHAHETCPPPVTDPETTASTH